MEVLHPRAYKVESAWEKGLWRTPDDPLTVSDTLVPRQSDKKSLNIPHWPLFSTRSFSMDIPPVSKQIWALHPTSVTRRFSPYKAHVFTGKMCLPNLTTSPRPKQLVALISTHNSSRCRGPPPSAFSRDIRSQTDAVFPEEHCQHSYPMHRNDGRFSLNGSIDSQSKFMFLFSPLRDATRTNIRRTSEKP